MEKLLLTIWIFFASLFGVNHQLLTKPTSPASQPTLSTLMSTATLVPDQIKATYTFYIQATPHKTSGKGLGLSPSDAGKTFSVDIGTLIILRNFGGGRFYIAPSSPQNIFTNPNPSELPASVPFNSIGIVGVFHAGFGTITVYEKK